MIASRDSLKAEWSLESRSRTLSTCGLNASGVQVRYYVASFVASICEVCLQVLAVSHLNVYLNLGEAAFAARHEEEGCRLLLFP